MSNNMRKFTSKSKKKECKSKDINSEEYRRLYTELMQRMNSLFSQGYTLLTIVGVVWSLAATALGILFQKEMLDFSAGNLFFALGLNFVIIVLFGLPALIAFAFSVKHHDNLRAAAK